MQLGKKIRELRLRRGLTVQQLAEASHLSKGFISQLENEHTSPSLASLRDLATALGTTVAYLVVEEEPMLNVVRAAERPQVRVGGNTSKVEVLSAQPKRNVEMLMVELPPDLPAGDKRHSHHGEQCILCVEGRLRLCYGEQEVTLEAGDSCHYDGRVSHALENAGTQTARVLIAMAPAAFEPVLRARMSGAGSQDRPVKTPTGGNP
jgi:transcriptional regulator with XRE-family HTH domain